MKFFAIVFIFIDLAFLVVKCFCVLCFAFGGFALEADVEP